MVNPFGAPPKHGMWKSPEYHSWQAMKARCLNVRSKDYKRYGALGVTICPQWRDSFEAFYADIGRRPSGTTLERLDTQKGYEPGNVVWGTPTEQACNRRSSFIWFIKGRRFESAGAAAIYFAVSDVTIHKWTKGYHDKRRGTFAPAKDDCCAIRRY